ncbi:tigger transposable element-derived protein 6-like [Octopus sinensis]|uniref:Tigger transposable element-derived protein 6-like n=1 Tax=Octopus sinensis TaxID=2607531 RepID=A0A6P7TYX8_9MOLL|nr:tigger transposable element-derived protein 6-like [Octopus sinensis]XP_029654671.1 tigger transposable element-derived protein 6-like [Octopus sinensis]
MGLNKFKASNGWLEKFKQRHELKFRTLSGESASADHAIILNFLSELNIKVEQYGKENIFNCDETSLFIKLTPRKSFVKTGDSARGFKRNDQDLFIESLSKLNLRQVVTIISDAWNNVSADIIYNCWQKVFRQSPSDSSCINESSE